VTTRTGHVLLIEDDVAWADLTREAFVEVAPDTEVEVLHGGEDALRRLRDENLPDVVLLDLNMPGTDGRDVIRALRAMPNTDALEVIVLSASVSPVDRALVRELGVSAYVTKPTSFSGLCDFASTVVSSFSRAGSPVLPNSSAPDPARARLAEVAYIGEADLLARLVTAGVVVEVAGLVASTGSPPSTVDCIVIEIPGDWAEADDLLGAVARRWPGLPVVAVLGSDAEGEPPPWSSVVDVVPRGLATPAVLGRAISLATGRPSADGGDADRRALFEAAFAGIETYAVACGADGRAVIGDRAMFPEQEHALRQALTGLSIGPVQVTRAGLDDDVRCALIRAVPLRDAEGDLIGAVATCCDVSDQRRLERTLTYRALHDPLTGLPNRVLAMDRLEHALATSMRRQGATAVLFIDLDGFKAVNDAHGHVVGDQVLEAVASRLQGAMRAGDTVVRYGGDEFLVVSESVPAAADAVALAARVHTALEVPLLVEGVEVRPSASIGVALAHGVPTAEQLLRQADAAMYEAKRLGGHQTHVHEPDAATGG
jgi:diguanylate cyclase (GGDEF)-like protein